MQTTLFYTEENDSCNTYEYVKYNGKTICFNNYKNSVMRAYVIELCNDSIKQTGNWGQLNITTWLRTF